MGSYAWEQPLCLIENDKKGFKLNQVAFDKIRKIQDPIVVIGIAGLYRTGKSYLMNRLAQRQTGFALGSTVQSKTKGIWCWCTPHPRKKNTCLLLLDTEGLGDAEKGSPENDAHIFVICVLLSSTLVYNSLGTIDNDAIDKLHFITELSEHVKVKVKEDEDGEDADFDRLFPTFVWTVRDFNLELTIDGQETDSDGYLENALKLKKGKGKKANDHNLPRECIRQYFPNRKCFTFPAPVTKREEFKKLDSLSADKLDPEFLEVSQNFVDYIFNESPYKDVDGMRLNGSSFATLCKCYTEAIQKGAVPCIERAIEMTAKLENENAVNESLRQYLENMKTIVLPTDTVETISKQHQPSEKVAIALFLKLAMCDTDLRYQKKLQDKIKEEYHKLCERNSQASKDKCSKRLQELYQPIQEKAKDGHFSKIGGYVEYKSIMDKVIKDYKTTPNKGIKAEEILKEFIQSKEAEGKGIMMADSKMKEEEKKAEEAKKQAEIEEQKRKAAEEEQKQIKQKMEDQEKSAKENIEQLEKKMKEDADNFMDKAKKDLDNRLKEQEKLMSDGFKDKADEMKDEISKMRQSHDEARLKAQMSSDDGGGGFLGFVGNALQTGLSVFAMTGNPMAAAGTGVLGGVASLFK